ncbi:hypothetical protein EDB85DRAFT_2158440 [Lactarius pseudohatsudake]|nr:hypothetical protein EDB85DRAFT_2158440 [Lactarius pseudohatsudake]
MYCRNIHKTRASQASSSEKLMCLKQELATVAKLVTSVLKCEQLKREAAQQAKRHGRKFPFILNAKEDEELFYNKEIVVKKPKLTEPTYLYRGAQAQVARQQQHNTIVRPLERAAAILPQVDHEKTAITIGKMESRMHIGPSRSPMRSGTSNGPPRLSRLDHHHHCCRHLRPLLLTTNRPLQNGVPSKFAGIMEVYYVWTSRRSLSLDELVQYLRRSTNGTTTGSEENEEQCATDREVSWPIRDRWLFDADNEPSVGNDGPDEKDRALLNEFHPTYLLKGMSLYQEDDHSTAYNRSHNLYAVIRRASFGGFA